MMKKYVARPTQSIKCTNLLDGKKMSTVSFDFLHDGHYSEEAIENAVWEAMQFCGCELEGIDFYPVDYSMYDEYADEEVSQCGCDFSYVGSYDANKLEIAIENAIANIGMPECGEVVGIDFKPYER